MCQELQRDDDWFQEEGVGSDFMEGAEEGNRVLRGPVLGGPWSEEDIWSVSAQGWRYCYRPGGSKHLLVGYVAGQHSPAPQVHQPNELENIEGW